MVEHPLVDIGARRNLVDAGAGEPLTNEFRGGCLQNGALGALRIALACYPRRLLVARLGIVHFQPSSFRPGLHVFHRITRLLDKAGGVDDAQPRRQSHPQLRRSDSPSSVSFPNPP